MIKNFKTGDKVIVNEDGRIRHGVFFSYGRYDLERLVIQFANPSEAYRPTRLEVIHQQYVEPQTEE